MKEMRYIMCFTFIVAVLANESDVQSSDVSSRWQSLNSPTETVHPNAFRRPSHVSLPKEVYDYCSIKSCTRRTHTFCKYPSSRLGSECRAATEVGLSKSEKSIIVQRHNELRQRVASGKEKRGSPGPQPAASFMPNLEWDNELEEIAQRWANQCTYGHDQCRNVERYKVGQNVAITMYSSENHSKVEEMVQDWYNEVSELDKAQVSNFNPPNFDDVGHYTQLVWADTTKIGCGRIKYKENGWFNQFLVCNYGPSGNFPGQQIYRIKK